MTTDGGEDEIVGSSGLLQVVGNQSLAELLDGAGLRQIPGAEFFLELSLVQVVVGLAACSRTAAAADLNVAVTESACSRRAWPTESAFWRTRALTDSDLLANLLAGRDAGADELLGNRALGFEGLLPEVEDLVDGLVGVDIAEQRATAARRPAARRW